MGKEEIIDILTDLGEYTGKNATLDECHEKGYWHRAVFCLIVNYKGEILLQKRSPQKKLWPNKWDISVGGHVRSKEFGREALTRECKEELGITVCDDEIKFIVSTLSKYNKNGYINNHFDECYLIIKDINIDEIALQEEEVSDVSFFSQDDILQRINNNYDGLTKKETTWPLVEKIIESKIIDKYIGR